jgi:hypothetical protein
MFRAGRVSKRIEAGFGVGKGVGKVPWFPCLAGDFNGIREWIIDVIFKP